MSFEIVRASCWVRTLGPMTYNVLYSIVYCFNMVWKRKISWFLKKVDESKIREESKGKRGKLTFILILSSETPHITTGIIAKEQNWFFSNSPAFRRFPLCIRELSTYSDFARPGALWRRRSLRIRLRVGGCTGVLHWRSRVTAGDEFFCRILTGTWRL